MTISAPISRRTLLAAAASFAMPPFVRAQEGAAMRLRFTFAGQDFTATLEDNSAARDLFSMLPLDDLEIDNYADNEKIAYLPRKLTEEGSGPFENE
jgi:hypothetical protein